MAYLKLLIYHAFYDINEELLYLVSSYYSLDVQSQLLVEYMQGLEAR